MMLKQQSMKWYLAGAAIGLLAGALLYFVQPVQWKGQALVRIGQFSQNQNQNQNNSAIESMPTVVERLSSRSFIKDVAVWAKRNEIEALLNVDEKSGMAVKPLRNSDSLVITIVGNSSELVRVSTEAVVAELISKHDAILSAYKADIQSELFRLDADADNLSKRIAKLTETATASGYSSTDGKWVVSGFSYMVLQHDLENKLNRSSLLRETISSTNIRPTTLIEPVSVSERRIFSSLWRACLFGTLLGTLLVGLWIRSDNGLKH